MVLEFIGYLAGFVVAIALSPQLIKAWRTKSTKDISITWNLILMIGLLLWAVYGIANSILPLAIFALVEFSMALSLFFLKLRYG